MAMKQAGSFGPRATVPCQSRDHVSKSTQDIVDLPPLIMIQKISLCTLNACAWKSEGTWRMTVPPVPASRGNSGSWPQVHFSLFIQTTSDSLFQTKSCWPINNDHSAVLKFVAKKTTWPENETKVLNTSKMHFFFCVVGTGTIWVFTLIHNSIAVLVSLQHFKDF